MSDEELDALIEAAARDDSSPSEKESGQVESPDPDFEVEPEETETVPADESADGKTDDEGEIERKAAQSPRFQEKINKLTKLRYEERRAREEAERKLAELQQKFSVKPPLRLEDFDYDEDAFNAAKDERIKEEARAEARAEIQKTLVETEVQRVGREWNEKIKSANIPDYAETVKDLDELGIPDNIASAIVKLPGDKGPRIAYYYAKHLDKAEQLFSMSPEAALIEIGEVSAKLTQTVAKLKTKAPDPTKPLKTGGKLNKSMADMSMEEIDALEIKARR